MDANRTEPLTVTVQGARNITGLGNTTIYELLKNGELKSIKIGRRRLILYSSIAALIAPAEAA